MRTLKIRTKKRDIWQYGDFQTPYKLAQEVCATLNRHGIQPRSIIEPTCGCGIFLEMATKYFSAQHLLGIEINPIYVKESKKRLGDAAVIEQGNFFAVNWESILRQTLNPLLILGNPPWVTNADLGLLQSTNLPIKNNFQGLRGLDAITGKSNFDISEWMLLKQIEWLRDRSGWVAMLIKTSVARKILRHIWKKGYPVGRAAIYEFNAMQYFDAAVQACLFVLPISIGTRVQSCNIFGDLADTEPRSTIGFPDSTLVSDVHLYARNRDLIRRDSYYVWRSGIKHDCAKVMEISTSNDGRYTNGLGEKIDLEPDRIFPLLKSSDVANDKVRSDRYMLVTQYKIGEDTDGLRSLPKTWRYLTNHVDRLDGRASATYQKSPRFSIFGVGAYTFAPWKIAISGFYKSFNFMKVGPIDGKPVVFDDTVYFLPCQSEDEADFVRMLVRSEPFVEILGALVFPDEKRPITASILKRISLERVAMRLGVSEKYRAFRTAHSKIRTMKKPAIAGLFD